MGYDRWYQVKEWCVQCPWTSTNVGSVYVASSAHCGQAHGRQIQCILARGEERAHHPLTNNTSPKDHSSSGLSRPSQHTSQPSRAATTNRAWRTKSAIGSGPARGDHSRLRASMNRRSGIEARIAVAAADRAAWLAMPWTDEELALQRHAGPRSELRMYAISVSRKHDETTT